MRLHVIPEADDVPFGAPVRVHRVEVSSVLRPRNRRQRSDHAPAAHRDARDGLVRLVLHDFLRGHHDVDGPLRSSASEYQNVAINRMMSRDIPTCAGPRLRS